MTNKSYQTILDMLKEHQIHVKYPIMLTADQYDTEWSISVGFTSTGLKLAKSSIDISEIRSLQNDEETRGLVIINKVFEAKK